MGTLKQLNQMYKMAVWDNKGRQYLPIYGRYGDIIRYGHATEAIDNWLNQRRQT